MCDYSLQGLPNRLAVEGEELVTYRFPTGSLGMASPAEIAEHNQPKPQPAERANWWTALMNWFAGPAQSCPVPAVCIPPGTRLLMSRIPDGIRRELSLNALEEVTFTQTTPDAFQYRDAIRFTSGRQVLLQVLREGIRFEVLRSVPEPEPVTPNRPAVSVRAIEEARLVPER